MRTNPRLLEMGIAALIVVAAVAFTAGDAIAQPPWANDGKYKPDMDLIANPLAAPNVWRQITLRRGSYNLHYHTYWGFRMEHLQALIRLPDKDGNEYYMGTYSQDVDGSVEGGMVFVGKVPANGATGDVIWLDEMNNSHIAGGFNHPGDLLRLGSIVIIAGQNWDGGKGKLDRGNGGQAVLFYDVSNPTAPSYIGKLNACHDGNVLKTHRGDIDTIGLSKQGSRYFLDVNEFRCEANALHPEAEWKVVPRQKDRWSGAPAKFRNANKTDSGRVLVDCCQISWQRFVGNSGETEEVLNLPADLARSSIYAMSHNSLPNGRYCVIAANVESDGDIIFVEHCQ